MGWNRKYWKQWNHGEENENWEKEWEEFDEEEQRCENVLGYDVHTRG